MPASRSDVTPESVLARRNKTQRVHHAQLVGYAPVLDHFSVLEPRDVDHVDERRFSRRGPAREATDVRAAAALVLDRPRRDQLVGNRQVALVEALLDQTPVDSLVGGG